MVAVVVEVEEAFDRQQQILVQLLVVVVAEVVEEGAEVEVELHQTVELE